MPKVEVIIAARDQSCIELYRKMNLKSDCLICNQTDHYDYEEQVIDGHDVRMISTNTRGVGINRNLGLQLSQGDIILLGDEDNVYSDIYTEMVEKAFAELPDADVIAFELDYVANGKTIDTDAYPTKRRHLWNGLSYGAAKIAFRRNSFLRMNLSFTDLFGGGTMYSAGEDSKFLVDCYLRGLHVYSYHGKLGTTLKETSSWFTGYHEKYFYDKGALIAAAYPRWLQLPMLFYYYLKFHRRGNLSGSQIFGLLCNGKKGYRTLRTYDDFVCEKGK